MNSKSFTGILLNFICIAYRRGDVYQQSYVALKLSSSGIGKGGEGWGVIRAEGTKDYISINLVSYCMLRSWRNTGHQSCYLMHLAVLTCALYFSTM